MQVQSKKSIGFDVNVIRIQILNFCKIINFKIPNPWIVSKPTKCRKIIEFSRSEFVSLVLHMQVLANRYVVYLSPATLSV